MITTLSTQAGRRYPQMRSVVFTYNSRLPLSGAAPAPPVTLLRYLDLMTGNILVLLPLDEE